MLLNTIAKLCFQRYILFIHQTLLIIQIFKYSNNYMGRKGSYMLRIIPAGARHFEDSGWLKSYMLFSFSNYYDPHNVQFGNLRAFNDDTVQPGKGGFSAHRHSEMEIISVVLDGGEIMHEDSMGGNRGGTLGKEEVQSITAGTGILHSEFNRDKEILHFYQIWILPSRSGLEPSYSQKSLNAWNGEISCFRSLLDRILRTP